jgi:hypothetical protein
MDCKHWNPEWVASLYDELDDAQEREMHAHVDTCAACRAELDSLASSRLFLSAAEPEVPEAPRVVVLQTAGTEGKGWHPFLTFAAGLATAAAVVGLGFLTATTTSTGLTGVQPSTVVDASSRTSPPDDARPAGSLPQEDEAIAEIRTQFAAQLAAMKRRIDELEDAPSNEPALTAAQFQREIERLEDRFERDRAGDLEFLMRSMTAKDLRTADWMDRTQQALTYIAARQNPDLSER